MPRVVVLDGYTVNPGDNSWSELEQLAELSVYERTPPNLVIERSRGCQVVITNKVPFDAATLEALPELRGICVSATGYNIVDLEAASRGGVAVCNVPAYSTASVVEHTFALLFELCRRVGLHDRLVHEGHWASSPDFAFWRTPQIELHGLRFGVVGYGSIGSAVARVAQAFGMVVLSTPSRQRPPESFVTTANLDTVFEQSDVVSLHCPLTEQTRGLVDEARLRSMKRSAFLINTSRGALVQELDLADALRDQTIAGAALDVLSQEPPPPDHPLTQLQNCIITPHLAWTSLAARKRLLRTTVENVRGILQGKPINRVNR
ncbi:MAG TPA: D-2-hydroxyacid dehydrogenase [Polyangiaceae bacterium]|nr:D-2-hydroxyacid dehydrogenase [Polyangiaceae bacterium]